MLETFKMTEYVINVWQNVSRINCFCNIEESCLQLITDNPSLIIRDMQVSGGR